MPRTDAVIYIPTYQRTDRQKTYRWLPDEFKAITWIVCPADEVPLIRGHYPNANFLPQPPDVKTIAQKRAWLIEQCERPKMLMLDDDLRFCIRQPWFDAHASSTAGMLRTPDDPNDPELIAFLHTFFDKLDDYAHAGISSRQNNNRQPKSWKENTRGQFALGYRPETLRRECELGRIETREDFDYTLQLLRAGFKNVVGFDVCINTASYSAKGGTEGQRTLEAADADARKLADLHPGLVKVKQRQYKGTSPDRLEVVCQWRRAHQQSRRVR